MQSLTGDGGVGGVSPSSRMFSQSYPSIYSSGAASRRGGGGHAGDKERERGSQEAQRGRQRSGIVDVDEACEDEEEEEEEEDEHRAFGNESAGMSADVGNLQSAAAVSAPSSSGVFSMDEDSLSRDCEPFWSDGEEESTDGQWRPLKRSRSVLRTVLTLLSSPRLAERGSPAATAGHRHRSAGVRVPSGQRHGAGPLAARVSASVGLQREPVSSGRRRQRRTGERAGWNRRRLAC